MPELCSNSNIKALKRPFILTVTCKLKKMHQQEEMKYDYIIAGSGCSGLSLLYRLLKDPILNNKSILIIDKTEKSANDRTWCYWESEKGLFNSIVTVSYTHLTLPTTPYV